MSEHDLQELAVWWPDAVAAYEDAAADAEHARSLWVKAGRPLVSEHKNGTSGQHPLWQGLVQADGVLARRRGELGLAQKARPGRPTGSAGSPSRLVSARSPEEVARAAEDWRAWTARWKKQRPETAEARYAPDADPS